MKRYLPHLGVVIGIAIAVYALFFSDSEEDRIRAKLDQLEDAARVSDANTNIVVRTARVKKEFAEVFDKDVRFEIPELTSDESGRDVLVGLAAQAPRMYQTVSVDLGGLDITVDEAGLTAIAQGPATLTGTRGGQLERDDRTVSLSFDKIEGDWKVVMVSVSAAGQ